MKRPLKLLPPRLAATRGRLAAMVWGLLLGPVGLLFPAPLPATGPSTPDASVRPAMLLLRNHCFGCHNEEKRKGGLRLDQREPLLTGGDSGPAVVSGRPAESRLIQLLAQNADPHMPPKKQLREAEIRVLADWVAAGVPWDSEVLELAGQVPPSDQLAGLPPLYRPVLALAVTTNGQQAAFSRGSQLFTSRLVPEGIKPEPLAAGHRDAIQALAWHPAGRLLASASYRRVAINLVEGPLQTAITNGLQHRLTALTYSADGTRLLVADGLPGESGWIRVLDPLNGQTLTAWQAHDDTIQTLAMSPDGSRLASGGADKQVKLWDWSAGQEVARLEGHTAMVTALAFDPSGRLLASSGADREVKVWDVKTRQQQSNHRQEDELEFAFPKFDGTVSALAWAPNGQAVVTADESGRVRWTTQLKKQPQKQFEAAPDALLSLVFAGSQKLVLAGTQAGELLVWREDGKLLARQPPEKLDAANQAARPNP